jgi:thiol-disulfide isomerase/thioredoxin
MRSLIASLIVFLIAPVHDALAEPSRFELLDRPAAQALTAPASHTEPTVVALWSSECPHCKKNLKLFADLMKRGHRFTLVTVATERPFDGLAAPLDKLAVPGQRFAFGDAAPEALAFALDPKWRGELPRTVFFDGRGGKVAVSGVVDAETALRHLGLSLPR